MLSAISISELRSGSRFFVADLGGTYLRCALAERERVSYVRRYRLHRANKRPGDVWRELLGNIAAYCRENGRLASPEAPLILAFPGPVTDGRIAYGAPTLIGREKVPDLAARVAEIIEREVIIVNDVSAAAWYFARRLQVDRFAVVTVSSGIGAKLFDRRHAGGTFDELAYAGEIGHLVVNRAPDAPICDCGGRGHLGAIASGRGIERSARRIGNLRPEKFATSACATLFGARASSLTNEEHLVPAALIGDSWTLDIIHEAVRPLAAVLHTLIVGVGLERVVFMGGFAQRLGARYLSVVRKLLLEAMDAGPAQFEVDPILSICGADEEPGLLGAACYGLSLNRVPQA